MHQIQEVTLIQTRIEPENDGEKRKKKRKFKKQNNQEKRKKGKEKKKNLDLIENSFKEKCYH